MTLHKFIYQQIPKMFKLRLNTRLILKPRISSTNYWLLSQKCDDSNNKPVRDIDEDKHRKNDSDAFGTANRTRKFHETNTRETLNNFDKPSSSNTTKRIDVDQKFQDESNNIEWADILNDSINDILVDYPVSEDLQDALDQNYWKYESFPINLFRGTMVTTHLFPFPSLLNQQQSDDLKKFLEPIYEFFRLDPTARVRHDVQENFESKDLQAYSKLGLFIMSISKKYGGFGFNHTQQTRVLQMLGAHDLNLATLISIHEYLGVRAIKLFGTLEQKEIYFTKVKQGSIFSCGLYETKASSDISSMQTRATKSSDGNFYYINGSKTNVINATYAELFIVFALAQNEQTNKLEITCFICEKGFGGVEISAPMEQMGMRAAHLCTVNFKNCIVPKENILGKPTDGFRIAMMCLNSNRFSIGPVITGAMRDVIQSTATYANNRMQFGQKIYNFGAVQSKLTDMAVHQYVSESISYMTAGNIDSGFLDCYIEAAISKCFSSKVSWYILDHAMQIFGGKGYLRETGIEQIKRDVRFYRYFGGTGDILRLFISLTGIQQVSIDNEEVQKTFNNPNTHLGLIFGTPQKRKLSKSSLGGMTELTPTIVHLVHPALQDTARSATRVVIKFGNIVEILLDLYGKDIVNQQFALIELAECCILSYAMLCALSRCTRSLFSQESSAAYELTLTKQFCIRTSARIEKKLNLLETKTQTGNRESLEKITYELIKSEGCADKGVLGF